MKYRDLDGQFKEITIKTSDTLPVGSVVEYDGSTPPTGWAKLSDHDGNVIVSSEEPTTGEEVWIQRSGNIFDSSTLVAGDIIGDFPTLRMTSRQELWLEAGTYIVSTNLSSTYQFGVQIQNIGKPPLNDYVDYIYDSKWTDLRTLEFTINEGGWFILGVRKADNKDFSLSDITGFNYKLEKPKKIHTKTDNGYEEFYNEEEVNKVNYSTIEQRIGTWIDGKPLYRKTIVNNSIVNGGKDVENVTPLDIENIDVAFLGGESFYRDTKSNFTFGMSLINHYESINMHYVRTILNIGNKKITSIVGAYVSSSHLVGVFNVYYTKTTD